MDNVVGCLAIIALIALIVASPLLVIWSLNTLFGLGIAYTFKTWIAALLLSGVFSSSAVCRR